MLAAIHFAVLVVLPVWAGYAIRRRYEAPTSPRMIAAIAFGGAAGLIGVSQMHLCHEGTPLAQWMLPGATASASMLFVQSRPLRRAIAFVSIVAALGLSTSFTTAVHGTTYTGNPGMNPGARSEWHSFLTGLYRRSPAP